MKTFPALSLVLLGPLTTASPQGQGVLPERAAALQRVQAGPAPAPTEHPPLTAATLSPGVLDAANRPHGILEQNGEAIGYGQGFKVFFEEEGVEFHGGGSSLVLRLEEVTRGGITRTTAGASAPSLAVEGRSALYDHGDGLVERYDVLPRGVEQSFVFERPLAGHGDLVVRLALETELRPEALGETWSGLRLLPQGSTEGGVRIGEVLGIDAESRTAAGSIRVQEGRLELVLPHEFVETAAYPLILDPFITSGTINIGSEAGATAAAYDETNHVYCVVWDEPSPSGTDNDIWYALVDADAPNTYDGPFPLELTTLDSVEPDVANINETDMFLAVHTLVDPGVESYIFAGSIRASTGAIVGGVLLAQGSGAPAFAEVCGDRVLGFDKAIVAYTLDLASNISVAQVEVPSFDYPSVVGVQTTLFAGRPRLSKSLSPDGYAMLVAADSSLFLWTQVVRYDGALVFLGTMTTDYDLQLTGSYEVDGDDSGFHILVTEFGVLRLTELSYDESSGFLDTGLVTSIAGGQNVDPSIGKTSDGLILSWFDGVFVNRATMRDGVLCESTITAQGLETGIATVFSGTSPTSPAAADASRGLIAIASTVNSAVNTFLVDAEFPASETPYNGATFPNAGQLLPGVTTSLVTGETWDPTIQFAPGEFPGPPFLLILSLASLEIPGVGVAPNGTVLVSPVSPFFTILNYSSLPMTVPIPSDCTLGGLKLYAQGGYNRILPAPMGFSLTSGLELIVGTE